MDLLDVLLAHDQWATETFLDLSQNLTDAQLDQEFDVGRRTLRETLTHQIYVPGFWTAQMEGRPLPAKLSTRPTVAELRERHRRDYATFAACARRVRDAQLQDQTFSDHYNIRQSLGATVPQVILHNAQHRAEARHMLERLGVTGLWDYDPQEWQHLTQWKDVAQGNASASEVAPPEAL